MSMSIEQPSTPAHLLGVARALGDFVNTHLLVDPQNVIAHAIDHTVDGWEKMPAAWYVPKTRKICINLGIMYRENQNRLRGTRHRTAFGHMMVGDKAVVDQIITYLDEVNEKTADDLRRTSKPKVGELFARMRGLRDAYNESPDRYMHAGKFFALQIIGVFIHETGHSISSTFLDAEFFRKTLDGYGREIMTMFEELRCEDTQVRRLGSGSGRRFLRIALPIVVDPERFAADMDKAMNAGPMGGEIDIAAVALNSTLMLGREVTRTLLPYELSKVHEMVEDLVTPAKLLAMQQIWKDYIAIPDVLADGGRDAMECVERWKELFPESERPKQECPVHGKGKKGKKEKGEGDKGKEPGDGEGGEGDEEGKGGDGSSEGEGGEGESEEEGSGEGEGEGHGHGGEEECTCGDGEGEGPISSIAIDPTEEEARAGGEDGTGGGPNSIKSDHRPEVDWSKELKQAVNKAIGRAIESPDAKTDWDPDGPTPSRVSFNKTLKDEKRARERAGVTEKTVTSREIKMAQRVGRELEKLSLIGRAKFKVRSVVPPGRLKGRAAMQRVAEKRSGRMPTSEPWNRTKTIVDVNPPLTVGIGTDVSGSQGWATHLSSTLSWVLARAVHDVNGRVASVAFGEVVVPTLRPGELPTKRIEIPARQGHESFDQAVGTLDVMLNLMQGTGVRLLFFITDGFFVKSGEQARAVEWVRRLTKQGVAVVWITREDVDTVWNGITVCPPGASHVKIDIDDYYSTPDETFVAEQVERVTNTIRQAITEARSKTMK